MNKWNKTEQYIQYMRNNILQVCDPERVQMRLLPNFKCSIYPVY